MIDQTTVGVNELEKVNAVSVYPNPAQNQFFVHSKNEEENEKIDLQVFDITGKSILHTSVIKNEAIDIGNFAKGIYLVKLKTENSTNYYTQKLIIE